MNTADDYNLNPSYSSGRATLVMHEPASLSDVNPSVEIAGINFSVLSEGKWVALQCDEWPSLSGYGSTLEEAREMLYETIEDARKAYVDCDENDLTEKALKFRAFLIEQLAAQ